MKYLNYLGQLRMYSTLDIIIFATALTINIKSIIGIALLWISYLLYLESRHKDDLRLKIGRFVWLITFMPTFFLMKPWVPPLYAVSCFLYTQKKWNPFLGITSQIWRGLQNMILAVVFKPELATISFMAFATRNLFGDFRDAGYDSRNNTKSIPTTLGFARNLTWAFYAHLLSVVTTTIMWFYYSLFNIPLWILLLVIIVEIASYPPTPRISNPPYLNLYGQ